MEGIISTFVMSATFFAMKHITVNRLIYATH